MAPSGPTSSNLERAHLARIILQREAASGIRHDWGWSDGEQYDE